MLRKQGTGQKTYVCIYFLLFPSASDSVEYLNAILSNPTAQVIILFLIIRMVAVKYNVAISAVKFTNVLFGNWSLGTAINSPYLEHPIFITQNK